jgi:hypothetical protein
MEQNNVNSFKVKARVIAFYLPQFHPTPENDKWWGKGFTEWTNVGKAKPLFKGHYQPRVPADLGYYDLRMPEIREAQAEMAREAGIEGFCYWHYWFGNGRQILESPFNEVLTSGKPDFPFCLGWANESWTNKSWEAGTHKVKETILLEQIYNKTDHEKHFMALLSAFRDKRYITVDGKPLFLIFKPLNIPDVTSFITLWQNMAKENGLKGIYFVGIRQNMDSFSNIISDFRNKNNLINSGGEKYKEILDLGFDAVNSRGYIRAEYCTRTIYDLFLRWLMRVFFNSYKVSKCNQSDINKYLYIPEDSWKSVYPTLFPNWDRSPRSGTKARIYVGSTPELFQKQIKQALALLEGRESEHRILFLQSWNEWAEGNYVEPDLKYGHGYLEVLKSSIFE